MPRRLQRFTLLALLALGAPHSLAASVGRYTAEGVGAIVQHDQATARTRALQGAFRGVLEQAVTELLEAEVLVANLQAVKARLYARPLPYMRSYRVLWEYPDVPQKVYRVGVEAEVAVGEVRRALETLGLSRQRE